MMQPDTRNSATVPNAEQPAKVPRRLKFKVDGMTCGNCSRFVGEAVQSVPGMSSAHVNLEAGTVSACWRENNVPDPEAVIRAVTEAGFEIALLREDRAPAKTLAGWKWTLGVGLTGTIPLMLGEWVFRLGMEPWFGWVSFLLGGMVQLLAGAQFYRGTWSQWKAGSSNMDTLVSLGSTTAFGYSTWALLTGTGGHLYFMEAASIITLISLGHWMESRVSVRASDALKKLLDLAPPTAIRRNGDGTESQVALSELFPGDIVVLRPGDHVPTDGLVIEGGSAVDEAMLTGESAPVDKGVGAVLYTGTVNLTGRMLVQVTATGEDTALARIIEAVQRAQSSRANIQRLGDRVSAVFVPIVVCVAVAAGLWWGFAPASAMSVHHWLAPHLWPAHPPESAAAAAFIIAAAVLIVACPCAMGLATPAAIMAGANAAASHGILIRDGVALEKAGVVTAVLFDKTGTLTTGKPVMQAIWASPGGGDVEELAAALAQPSAHPMSRAIAGGRVGGVALDQWQETAGCGVSAVPAGKPEGEAPLRLGSLRWLAESGIDLAAGNEFIEAWTGKGATIVGLASGSVLLGLFALQDSLKPGAKGVVEELHRQGMEIHLVTGDNARTAQSIAAAVGIPADHVFAGVRPEEKAALVARLQQGKHRVAFVGDGINDAPALQQADLGIAVSRASDIAREAADIVLLNSGIEAVPASLRLARATLRTIKQNLFWAFFYNAAGIPLAALGFMSPVLCAAAMGFSDLIVIGNALRLRRFRVHKHQLR